MNRPPQYRTSDLILSAVEEPHRFRYNNKRLFRQPKGYHEQQQDIRHIQPRNRRLGEMLALAS